MSVLGPTPYMAGKFLLFLSIALGRQKYPQSTSNGSYHTKLWRKKILAQLSIDFIH